MLSADDSMPVAKTIEAPECIDSGAVLTDGLDLLGLRLPVQTIGGSLLDGVTTVTPAVRYIAFGAWLIYRYGESHFPDCCRSPRANSTAHRIGDSRSPKNISASAFAGQHS